MERYYTAAQIGEILGGMKPRAVRDMIKNGDFGDTVQVGKRHLVPESALEAYIKARTGPAEPGGTLSETLYKPQAPAEDTGAATAKSLKFTSSPLREAPGATNKK